MRRTTISALTALLLLTCLIACDDSDRTDGGTEDLRTGYAGPALPPVATEDSRAGAMAFAEHFIATYNYAISTGDLNGLIPLEDVACLTCQALRRSLAQVYDNGGQILGSTWRMLDPALTSSAQIDGWVLTSALRVAAGSGFGRKTPERTTRINLQISRTTGTWKVLSCDKAV